MSPARGQSVNWKQTLIHKQKILNLQLTAVTAQLISSGMRAAGGMYHLTHRQYWETDVQTWRARHGDRVAGGKTKQESEVIGETGWAVMR